MNWEKLSFAASMLSMVLPSRIQRFPLASGSSSKYFLTCQQKTECGDSGLGKSCLQKFNEISPKNETLPRGRRLF